MNIQSLGTESMTGEHVPDTAARQVIRNAIRTVLTGFAEQPLFDLRECDPQARLLQEIRARIAPADVPVRLNSHNGHARHSYAREFRTSRVHTEMRLDGESIDIVVFRDDITADLVVYPAGALDVVAAVRGEQLAAVIEVKAAPSSTQEPTFVRDLERLDRITAKYAECYGFFVLFDKSLHLGGAKSAVAPRFGWLDSLREAPNARIEAHFLSLTGETRSSRGSYRIINGETTDSRFSSVW